MSDTTWVSQVFSLSQCLPFVMVKYLPRQSTYHQMSPLMPFVCCVALILEWVELVLQKEALGVTIPNALLQTFACVH